MTDRGRDENGWEIPDMVIKPAPNTLIRMDYPDGTHGFIEVRDDGSHVSWSMGSLQDVIGDWVKREDKTDD